MFNTYAGHGGIDGGCSSADGVPEKGINLNIVLCLRDLFTANGYDVKLTRDDDRSIHACLVGSEMCIRDRRRYRGNSKSEKLGYG